MANKIVTVIDKEGSVFQAGWEWYLCNRHKVTLYTTTPITQIIGPIQEIVEKEVVVEKAKPGRKKKEKK